MAKKFQVNRIVQLVQSTAIEAANEKEAVEKSKKLKFKVWKTLDRKRRSGYEAKKISYAS